MEECIDNCSSILSSSIRYKIFKIPCLQADPIGCTEHCLELKEESREGRTGGGGRLQADSSAPTPPPTQPVAAPPCSRACSTKSCMWKLLAAAQKRELSLRAAEPVSWSSQPPQHAPTLDRCTSSSSCSCDSLPPLRHSDIPVQTQSILSEADEEAKGKTTAPDKEEEEEAAPGDCARHARLKHFESAWWVLCAAPMVRASDLPFRLLTRKYGARACFTQMLYSDAVLRDPEYCQQMLWSCRGDRPLVVQLAANDPKTLVEAGRVVESMCDAIDINLGCPQREARRDVYGSFLLSDPNHHTRVLTMVQEASQLLQVPVCVKIRLLEELNDTLELCRKLERAGASLLTVHGRKQGDVRHRRAGSPLLDQVKEIQEALRIPVITNGGIKNWKDVRSHLESTGAAGVMCGEGLLANPALFAPSLLSPAKENVSEAQSQHPTCNLCDQEKRFREWVLEESPRTPALTKLAGKRKLQELLGSSHKTAAPSWEPILYSEAFPPPVVSKSDLGSPSMGELDDKIVIPARLRPKFLNRVGLALEYLDWVEKISPELPLFLVRFHVKYIVDEPLWRTQLKDVMLESRSLLELTQCLVRCWLIVCTRRASSPHKKFRPPSSSPIPSSYGTASREDGPRLDPKKPLRILHRRRKALEDQEMVQSGWIRPAGLGRMCHLHAEWKDPQKQPRGRSSK